MSVARGRPNQSRDRKGAVNAIGRGPLAHGRGSVRNGRSPERASQTLPRQVRLILLVTGCSKELTATIAKAGRRVLGAEGFSRGRLEIAAIGEAEMRRQHRLWMGKAAATDVLSFDLRGRRERGLVDGQLLVCKTVARRVARRRGTDWRAELVLYVVHGCLHLCGYDDRTPKQAGRMHQREDELLSDLGWGQVFAG